MPSYDCVTCGKSFRQQYPIAPEKAACSKECKRHVTYGEADCERCGKTFSYPRHQTHRPTPRFCSHECYRPRATEAAELDHRVPLSDGGTEAIDNLQWIEASVNRAKGTMSTVAFVELCRAVVRKCENDETGYSTYGNGRHRT